jgi:glycosyltransferase involved in cell wall biosynthesis
VALREAQKKLASLDMPGLGNDKFAGNLHTHHILGRVYQHAREFDIIHDHMDTRALPFAELSPTPVVLTLHGNLYPEVWPLYEEFKRPYLVSISKSLQQSQPQSFNHVGVVYNGLALENTPFNAEHGSYLLFVGRICREKGTHHAITIAERLDLPLIIAAKLERSEQDRRYFRKYVRPRLNEKIKWIGEVNDTEKYELMKNALCFLHPITWSEPFGLTLIESMATGTPVVAFAKGSIPEIIDHGTTGFVVNTLNEMEAAVKNVTSLDRTASRQRVLTYFNEKAMTDGYEAVYKKILANHK